MLERHCFAVDLIDDPELIRQYIKHHKNVWPEVIKSLKHSGIMKAEIYHIGNRLFMMMEVTDDFSFERKQEIDLSNPSVIEWERLMWKYQKALPFANSNDKWIKMDKIFSL